MKKIVTFLLLFCGCAMLCTINAQSGFVAFGGAAVSNAGSWTYSVGQPAYTNATTSNLAWSEGVQQSFETAVVTECPLLVADFDAENYTVTRIGNLCWMSQNLRSQHYSDGTDIADVRVYNDNATNAALCGRLYTTAAAMRGATNLPVQGVCPEGWRLPTQTDLATLSAIVPNIYDLRSTTGWRVGNGNNQSGFNLYPAGYYNGALQRYENLHTEAYLITVDNQAAVPAPAVNISTYYCDQWLTAIPAEANGYSVRCVK